jgi:hypothetical protein
MITFRWFLPGAVRIAADRFYVGRVKRNGFSMPVIAPAKDHAMAFVQLNT